MNEFLCIVKRRFNSIEIRRMIDRNVKIASRHLLKMIRIVFLHNNLWNSLNILMTNNEPHIVQDSLLLNLSNRFTNFDIGTDWLFNSTLCKELVTYLNAGRPTLDPFNIEKLSLWIDSISGRQRMPSANRPWSLDFSNMLMYPQPMYASLNIVQWGF